MDAVNWFDNCNAQLEQKIMFLDKQQPISFVDITTTGAGGAGAKNTASIRHFDLDAQKQIVTSDHILLDGQLYKSTSIKGMLENYNLGDVNSLRNRLHESWEQFPGYRNYHSLLQKMKESLKPSPPKEIISLVDFVYLTVNAKVPPPPPEIKGLWGLTRDEQTQQDEIDRVSEAAAAAADESTIQLFHPSGRPLTQPELNFIITRWFPQDNSELPGLFHPLTEKPFSIRSLVIIYKLFIVPVKTRAGTVRMPPVPKVKNVSAAAGDAAGAAHHFDVMEVDGGKSRKKTNKYKKIKTYRNKRRRNSNSSRRSIRTITRRKSKRSTHRH